MVIVAHFCECSAGCEVLTPYWKHYCEHHSEELFVLEVDTLLDDGCPRCGLRAPEGLHLHRCSKRILRAKGLLKSLSGLIPRVAHKQLPLYGWPSTHYKWAQPMTKFTVNLDETMKESNYSDHSKGVDLVDMGPAGVQDGPAGGNTDRGAVENALTALHDEVVLP
jgi:hypothetical protein